ncbi:MULTISPECIES: hypothetical protein [Wolbachia]|uniref:hypothetical protein n=1 Tax=Wolbachia TaxID=953 RepID=UPI00222E6A1D|nr:MULTISPECIES: hypothetical protein [unclassified Wolbachia]GKS78267.1 hypothetical protein wHma_02740 [Wolbachia pipientis]
MIVGRKVLEHDPEKVCENKNIHADHKEHLVYREDNGSIKKYEEKENKFIEEAREYLLKRGFNSNFKLKGYYESSIFKSLTEIELKPINEKHIQV